MEQFRILYFLFSITLMALRRIGEYYSSQTPANPPIPVSSQQTKKQKKAEKRVMRPVPTWQQAPKKVVQEVPVLNKPVQQAVQSQRTSSRINRYNGWKKAVIMHEIIQPYSR